MNQKIYPKWRIALNVMLIILACFGLGYVIGKLIALL